MHLKSLLLIIGLAIPMSASADAGPPASANNAKTLTIDKAVEFDYLQVRVRSKARKELDAFVKSWRANPVHVTIEGHGLMRTEEASIELGQKRADRVRAYLVKKGIDPKFVTAIGHSRAEPGRYVDLVIAAQ